MCVSTAHFRHSAGVRYEKFMENRMPVAGEDEEGEQTSKMDDSHPFVHLGCRDCGKHWSLLDYVWGSLKGACDLGAGDDRGSEHYRTDCSHSYSKMRRNQSQQQQKQIKNILVGGFVVVVVFWCV